MFVSRIKAAFALVIIALVSVNCLRHGRPIILHNMRKDRYDVDRKAAVAELTCDYSTLQYCVVSCSQCHAVWSGVHQGKKVNVSESDEHVVRTNASECATHMEVMWTVASELNSYYDCKVTADYRHKKRTFLSNPHNLKIKIRLVAATEKVTAERGSNLNLFCPSKVAVPPKNLSDVRCIWWKNGTRVPTTSDKYGHSYRQILTIFNVTDSDAGSYECKWKGKGITKSAVERSVVTVTVTDFPDPPTAPFSNSTVLTSGDSANNTETPVNVVKVICIANGSTIDSYDFIGSDVTDIQLPNEENVVCFYEYPTNFSTISSSTGEPCCNGGNELDEAQNNQSTQGNSDVSVIIQSVLSVAFLISVVGAAAFQIRRRRHRRSRRTTSSDSPDTNAAGNAEHLKEIKDVTEEILLMTVNAARTRVPQHRRETIIEVETETDVVTDNDGVSEPKEVEEREEESSDVQRSSPVLEER